MSRHIPAMILRLLALFLGLSSVATADTTSVADSAVSYPEVRRDRTPIEFILALPSIALQLPFRVLAGVVAGPVILVERQELMPHLGRLVSSLEIDGIRPILGYSSIKGLTGGLAIRQRSLFSQGIGYAIKGSYSTNKYRFGSIELGGRHWGDGPFGLVGELGWQARTRERFHGLGPSSELEDESNYGFRGIFGSVQGFWDIAPSLSSRVFGGIRQIDPRDGGLTTTTYLRDSIVSVFDGQDLFGLFERLDLLEMGGQVTHDWRKRPGSPLGGGIEALRVSYVTGDGGDEGDIGFWRIRGEASHYLNIYRGRVIGVRVLAQVTEPDDGTRVPFYELSQLGGSQNLRGFRRGRFVDRDMAMFTVEYRWPLWRTLDAFLFTSQGRVFANLEEDFEFSNFRSAYGGGIRIWNQMSTGEIAVAKSNEKLRFYLSLGAL